MLVIHPGLVSITFRKLRPRDIVNLVAQAGLDGIEWGGDVHVPHGNLAAAREAMLMTRDAGLHVAAYGSYYKIAQTVDFTFEDVVATAQTLGAPTIRVWAGARSSADADADYRQLVVAESHRIATLAAAAGMTISYEAHGGTLTDTNASALRLMQDVSAEPAIKTYWQPSVGAGVEYCFDGLTSLLPWLTHVHVFQWWPAYDRQPLADGRDVWRRYLRKIAATGGDHYAMIEFVKDDEPANFLKDAATLKSWLQTIRSSDEH
jgi:3-dehydroshikimate dehydratase